MSDTNLVKVFETALSVHSPWTIDSTELIPNEKNHGNLEMHVYVSFPRGAKFACPICGEEHRGCDTQKRVWRHLNFFQYPCYIHAKVPGIECSKHGVRTVDVPWEREGSGFTMIVD